MVRVSELKDDEEVTDKTEDGEKPSGSVVEAVVSTTLSVFILTGLNVRNVRKHRWPEIIFNVLHPLPT